MYLYICIYTHIYICIHISIHTCIRIRIHIYTYLFIFICISIHICIYMHKYICMYIHIHTHTYSMNYVTTHLSLQICLEQINKKRKAYLTSRLTSGSRRCFSPRFHSESSHERNISKYMVSASESCVRYLCINYEYTGYHL